MIGALEDEGDGDHAPVHVTNRVVVAASVAVTLLNLAYPLGQWAAWQPWARGDGLLWLWPIAAALTCVGMVTGAVLSLVQAHTRPLAPQFMRVALVALATAGIAVGVTDRVIQREIERFAARNRPVVAALERYERERGGPPPSLAALVPAYLPRVPATGIGAMPSFRLERGLAGWQLVVPSIPGGMARQLVFSPHGRPGVSPHDRQIGGWWLVDILDD